ncbi:hypothetical protein CLOM_g22780 [Closterium sp. NIES-68]|nr:hypothetical protein CLOM_g22780 [Closterium sp. NIES-68]GJP76515.1 hypothetical protein CLOP_g6947 [Closterium sp. NIES-67]
MPSARVVSSSHSSSIPFTLLLLVVPLGLQCFSSCSAKSWKSNSRRFVPQQHDNPRTLWEQTPNRSAYRSGATDEPVSKTSNKTASDNVFQERGRPYQPDAKTIVIERGFSSITDDADTTVTGLKASGLYRVLKPTATRGRRARLLADKRYSGYTTVSEVTIPIKKPKIVAPCRLILLRDAAFANTSNKPTIQVAYTPPAGCGLAWKQVVLSIGVRVKGIQEGRVLSIFFNGFELSRSLTTPGSANGVRFAFERDLTKFSRVLRRRGRFSITLENALDEVNTGIFYVDLEVSFYGGLISPHVPHSLLPLSSSKTRGRPLVLSGKDARGILGTSQQSPGGGALFSQASASVLVSGFPRNLVRAELDLTLTPHGDDRAYFSNLLESYYSGLPDSLKANFISGSPYREIVVYIDGRFAGSFFPFPVLSPSSLRRSLWTPVVGIGCFGLEPYSLDVTPFVGLLADGRKHNVTVAVSGVLPGGVWLASGVFRMWLDPVMLKTTGRITVFDVPALQYYEPPPNIYTGIDGTLEATAMRHYTIGGRILTSRGVVTSLVKAYHVLQSRTEALGQMKFLKTEYNVVANVTTRRGRLSGMLIAKDTVTHHFPLTITQTVFSDQDGSTSFKLSLSHDFQQQRLHNDNNMLTKSTLESLVNSQTCDLLEYGISTDSTGGTDGTTSSGTSSGGLSDTDGSGNGSSASTSSTASTAGTSSSATSVNAAGNAMNAVDGADATGVVVGPFSAPNLVVVGGSQTLSFKSSNKKACFWRNVESGGMQVLSDGSEHKC